MFSSAASKRADAIRSRLHEELPDEKVLADLRSHLDGCNWEYEIGENVIKAPESAPLSVLERRVTVWDVPNNATLSDHFSISVAIGDYEIEFGYAEAEYGIAMLAYDLKGRLVTVLFEEGVP